MSRTFGFTPYFETLSWRLFRSTLKSGIPSNIDTKLMFSINIAG